MSIEDKLADVCHSLDHIADQIDADNDFGNTIGDELASINHNVSRVADALEQILKIMRTVK
jgi:hypothetical protein